MLVVNTFVCNTCVGYCQVDLGLVVGMCLNWGLGVGRGWSARPKTLRFVESAFDQPIFLEQRGKFLV